MVAPPFERHGLWGFVMVCGGGVVVDVGVTEIFFETTPNVIERHYSL
jgi:hypothetical protein